MDNLLYGRVLTAGTLAVHVLFAVFGVGLPLMLFVAERLGIRRADPDYLLMARRWSKAFLVLFAVGAASGTVVAAELSVVWPSFMATWGRVIALPFLIEVVAFFVESAFLGLYLYGWDRFATPVRHWWTSVPIVIASAASAFLITTVNAFMNTPAGFTWQGGHPTRIHPWQALWNPSAAVSTAHVLVTAYAATGLVVAALAALSLLRGQGHTRYFRKSLSLGLSVGGVFLLLSVLTGDLAGKMLAVHQQEKLAAIEGHFHTSAFAPEILGGIPDPARAATVGGLRIPGLLSYLAYGNPSHPVTGLLAFPRTTWPPLFVHLTFDFMVLSGLFLLSLVALHFLWPKAADHPTYLRLVSAGGVLGLLTVEAGWVTDEVGRQPWIVQGFMTVRQAITTSPALAGITFLVLSLLLALGVAVTYLLLVLFRRQPLPEGSDVAPAHSKEVAAS